jgi:phospholipid/cholesterol/gamma-HCH transport system substrate-binding protein
MEGSMSAGGVGLRQPRGPSTTTRTVMVALLLLAVAVVAYLLFSAGGGYRVTATFLNAGQLVRGNEVQVGGVPVGSVEDVDVTDDGLAEVTF